MALLVYMLIITALCFALHQRKARPSLLYAAALIGVVAGLALIGLLIRQGPAGFAWMTLGSSTQTQIVEDRYYVTFRPASIPLSVAALAVLSLPLWLWLLERWGAMSEPALTRLLVWPLLGMLLYQPGVLLIIAFSSATPPIGLMRNLSYTATTIGLIGLVLLALLLLWCALRKLRA